VQSPFDASIRHRWPLPAERSDPTIARGARDPTRPGAPTIEPSTAANVGAIGSKRPPIRSMLRCMGFHVIGRLHRIFAVEQKTERFRKRDFVLELADGRFPQFVQFQLTGDRCEAIDAYRENDEVKVEFSLRGREWKSPKGETRFFNSLDVWTVERAAEGASRSDEPPMPEHAPSFADEPPF
jgi:single-strand DNA-binding protein